jgi:predicted metalloprotease with PDZ domain
MEQSFELVKTNNEVKKEIIENIKDFKKQSLATQAKKGEELVAMMPAVKKAFNIMADDIYELSTENEILKDKIGDYDENWLKESKVKLMANTTEDKKNKLILERMRNQLNKANKI